MDYKFGRIPAHPGRPGKSSTAFDRNTKVVTTGWILFINTYSRVRSGFFSKNIVVPTMEEYLTTNELSQRIKMTPGTIRNLVCKGKLVNGVHYIKPTSRKLLFIWSEIKAWLHGNGGNESPDPRSHGRSLINI